ncbi:MAG: hypothetical protein Q7V57_06245 [Actinomycetota bacterium]|nr:hypothetical protein [Actinomycetota bacterium]
MYEMDPDRERERAAAPEGLAARLEASLRDAERRERRWRWRAIAVAAPVAAAVGFAYVPGSPGERLGYALIGSLVVGMRFWLMYRDAD